MSAEKKTDAASHDTGNPPHSGYVLRLFVAGMTARSTRAVENIRVLCERYLPGGYDLEVINLYEQPLMASGEHIIAAPTCVRRFPLPARRVIGDMSNSARVLAGLDLVEQQ
jgi:circadian clock protein KaiB